MNNQAMTEADVYAILARPFTWDEVSVMPKSTADRNGQKAGLALVYFDARAVMARLDEAFGFMNWRWDVDIVSTDGIPPYARGTLTVRMPDGSETSRVEVSELTDIEPIKGGASGALKRAFTALGNRSLYEINLGWHEFIPNKRGGFGRWSEPSKVEMKKRYEQQVKRLEKQSKERATAIIVTEDPVAPSLEVAKRPEPTPEPKPEPKPKPKPKVDPEPGEHDPFSESGAVEQASNAAARDRDPEPKPKAEQIEESTPHPPITNEMRRTCARFCENIGAKPYMASIVEKVKRTFGTEVDYVWPIYLAAQDDEIKDLRSLMDAMGNPFYIRENKEDK